MSKKQIAVFDFCGTMVNFQSADIFIEFVSKKFPSPSADKAEKIRRFLIKSKIMLLSYYFKIGLNKKIIASKIKNISTSEITVCAQQFYNEFIRPNYIPFVIDYVFKCKEQGMHIVLVSAAYHQYLCQVADEFGFDKVISTKLRESNGVMSGKITRDVVSARKPILLNKYLNKNFGKNNYEIAFAISDSKSDLPILKIAKEQIVVSHREHQSWVLPTMKEVFY